MAYRLQVLVEGRRHRFALEEGENEVGSSPACAVRIPHATVSRRHAVISVAGDAVAIRDLGSHNGLRVGSRAVERAELASGTSFYIGGVPARLEQVEDDDLRPAVVMDGGASQESRSGTMVEHTTCASSALEELARQHLPSLLGRLEEGAHAELVARLVGAALADVLPGLPVEVTRPAPGEPGGARGEAVVFSTGGGSAAAEALRVGARSMVVSVTLPDPRLEPVYRPVVELGAGLVRLAEAREPASSGVPKPDPSPPPLPDPPTLDPALRAVYAEAARVAAGDVSVLILGESGTGKELLAGYLHRASHRAGGPFLGLNCASLPADLLEAELFGIERGVATGVEARPGKFELAEGGTLFLDEIGDMSLETQAKILRVLQCGEVYRVGGSRPRRVSVRIVAATNRDLEQMRADRLFREDLYHRIATWVAELPPLRLRRADIPNLAAHFLKRAADRRGTRVRGISRAALDRLMAFSWPGNVRQLENEMERAALFLEHGELLDSGSLSAGLREAVAGPVRASRLSRALELAERQEIELALAASGGNQSLAARRLGISRSTLYRRMRSFGIQPGAEPPA